MQTKLSMKSAFYTLSLSFYLPLSAMVSEFEEYDASDYKEQLYSTVSNLEMGEDADGKTIYYKVQPSTGQYLYLGANEVFFSPIGKLTSGGETNNPDLPLNNEKEFEFITRLDLAGDQLEWGFITTTFGNLHADVMISGSANDVGMVLSLQIDDSATTEFTISSEMVEAGYTSFDFTDLEEGFHTFKITVITPKKNDTLKIMNVRLSGDSAQNSYVVRERWRPNAAYSTWASSRNRGDVKAWVMELSTDSELGHYSPCTTEFGYFGPIFRPGGTARNMNMSIWSSGSEQDILPVNLQSHLLGIGSAEGVFGSFSHEGRGVKVERWNNFESNTSKKYVIGLRFVNEGDFTTFYGYFWNEQTENWQLYSVGRKVKDEPVKSMKTKAFIEVVGGPSQERSNHKPREVRYKGWVCNGKGVWWDLNQATIPGDDELTNNRRGITEDGEAFFTSAGGLQNTMPEAASTTIRKATIVNRPIYMDPTKLQGLFTVPFIPKITSAVRNSDSSVTVNFQTNTLLESNVTLCWGAADALSVENNWQSKTNFDLPAGDSNFVHSVEIPASADTKFFRILVRDAQAQMWSFETSSLSVTN
jgi:hypothetical protein